MVSYLKCIGLWACRFGGESGSAMLPTVQPSLEVASRHRESPSLLSCKVDQGLGPRPHVWSKNRTESDTHSTPLSVSSTSCPTCERHHREVPGTLISLGLWLRFPGAQRRDRRA